MCLSVCAANNALELINRFLRPTKVFIGLLKEKRFNRASRELQDGFKKATRENQEIIKRASRELQESFKRASRKL